MANEVRGMGPGRPGVAPMSRFTAGALETDNLVPVVLEFNQPPVAVYQLGNPDGDLEQYRKELQQMHRQFLEQLTAVGIDAQIGTSKVVETGVYGTRLVDQQHQFTEVFNGLGVLLPGRMVAKVAAMTGVRAVTMNREQVYLHLDKSIPFSGADKLWTRDRANGGPLRGENIKVAVIDTGVF